MLKTIQSKGLLYKTANCNIFKQVVANAYHSQKLVNIVRAICQMRCHKYDLSNKKKKHKNVLIKCYINKFLTVNFGWHGNRN